MKKLSLHLDALRVESFDTTPADQDKKGTVYAEQCTCYTNCTCPGCPTCDWTCGYTCDDNTCISCANTCQNTGCTRYQPCWE